jgi:hypothetical protein
MASQANMASSFDQSSSFAVILSNSIVDNFVPNFPSQLS